MGEQHSNNEMNISIIKSTIVTGLIIIIIISSVEHLSTNMCTEDRHQAPQTTSQTKPHKLKKST